MRIFAAGIATETNTFCPVPTDLSDFFVRRSKRAAQPNGCQSALDLTARWEALAKSRDHEYIFSLMAWAPPAGITVRSAYESLRDEMLEDLRSAMPVDIVLLMLHGAMVAQGCRDCEADIIHRVREIVGPDVVIGVQLDLHCHLSPEKIASADIVITLKEYPHVDSNDRAQELFELAIETKGGRIRPTMALFDCRMIGLYPTSREPLRAFVNAMIEAERRGDALSVSFGHGFPFGDVPHGGAKVLVVTDRDQDLARRLARSFAMQANGLRREIGFDALSLPMEDALSKALASTQRPVVVADQSDNPGGGAPGDSTFALHWLLDHRAEEIGVAIFYDPQVVKIAKKAGVGGRLPIRLGGKMSAFSGTPVDIEVTVTAMLANYSLNLPQRSGDPLQFPAGDVVALQCGTIDIVVGSEPCQCFSPAIFTDLGIDPTRKRILIPKSAQHFFDAFSPIASEIIYMAAPGAVSPDPRGLPYREFDTRNMYPWTEDPCLPP